MIKESKRDRGHIYNRRSLGDKIADGVVTTLGSWRFIIVQSVFLLFWLALNITGIIFRWDPYPFILLNLMLSFQAAYTGPIVLKAQNRQADRDRARDDHEAEEVDELFTIQLEQLEILKRLARIEAEIKDR